MWPRQPHQSSWIVVPLASGACSAIWRLVWAQRPRGCALSWQICAFINILCHAQWAVFPTCCTCRLLKVFAQNPTEFLFKQCFPGAWWQAWQPVMHPPSMACSMSSLQSFWSALKMSYKVLVRSYTTSWKVLLQLGNSKASTVGWGCEGVASGRLGCASTLLEVCTQQPKCTETILLQMTYCSGSPNRAVHYCMNVLSNSLLVRHMGQV